MKNKREPINLDKKKKHNKTKHFDSTMSYRLAAGRSLTCTHFICGPQQPNSICKQPVKENKCDFNTMFPSMLKERWGTISFGMSHDNNYP